MRWPGASSPNPLIGDPRRHHEREVAEVVAVGEPDGAAAGVGGGDRRRPDVEPARRHLCEQAGEFGADEVDPQPELVGDRAQQFVVEPGELARGVDADARRRIGQRADGQVPGVPGPARRHRRCRAVRRARSCTCPRPGPVAAAARLVGNALALSTPGGAHWSTWAPAGAARPMLQTNSGDQRDDDMLTEPVKRGHPRNVSISGAIAPVALIQNATVR